MTSFRKNTTNSYLILFRDIEKNDGREKIDEILKWRRNRIVKDAREVLAERKSIGEKIYALKDIA